MSHAFDPPRPPDAAQSYAPLTAIASPKILPPQAAYRPTPLTWFPVLLFLLTCYTTYRTGEAIFTDFLLEQGVSDVQAHMWAGLWYAVPLLITLLCHEFGHFLQARQYHVPASWPYFIPVPGGPLGTMGAVIGMRGYMGNRKALYDIGISGPLAGLGPALLFSVIGLHLSHLGPTHPEAGGIGAPLLFRWLASLIFGEIPPGQGIDLHPLAYAGWVGIFITALNLMPIGQLDGGHVLYALLRGKAHRVAQLLLFSAVVGVVLTGNYEWSLMLLLLLYMGPNHPPTANDDVPLGTGRMILGWLTLMFIFIGFTPRPFM